MKQFFTFCTLALLSNACLAQAPNWIWAQGTGLSGYEYGIGISASPTTGDIYVGGRLTNGTSTFMGGVTVTTTGTQSFHGRFQPNGNFVWAKAFPYSSFDYEQAFYRDASDNTYSTGIIQGGGGTMFIQRYNSAGTQTFSVVNGTGSTQGQAIVADSRGNIYAAGTFSSPATFGSTTLPSLGSEDVYLVKYDNTGALQWAKGVGSAGPDRVWGMTVDNNDNVYFTGAYTSGTATFGAITTPASTGYGSYFVAKYDPSGNAVWVTTVGSAGPYSSPDNAAAITADPYGNLYVTSAFQGTATFGSQTLTSLGGYDGFVGKLSTATGKWIWAKSMNGTSGRDEGTGIALDKDYDVYVCGVFQSPVLTIGTATLNNVSGGSNDIFVAKFVNSTGDLVWMQRGGGARDDNAFGLTVDNQKFVYVTGDFAQTTTFGTTTLNGGSVGDIFIAKLDTVVDRKISPQLSSYCIGSPHPLPYTIKGPFNAGNVYTAQLSDSSGNFASPIVIGSVTSTASGVITITIPPGTPIGPHYKIRIVSSSPVYSSLDSAYVTITGPCTPPILNGDSTTLDTIYCFENINHEIMGVPRTGVFTGCGIVDSGGKWFFNPALAANNAGNYPFKCSITYRLLTGEDSTQMMTVNQPETIVAGDNQITCTGSFQLAATIASLSKVGPYDITWSPATGLDNTKQLSTAGNISADSQRYHIQITNTATGCKSNDSITIYHDHFATTILPSADTICALNGITVRAQITPDKIVLYQWDMGDGTTAVTPKVQHIYDHVGSYTITLVTQDAYCSDTKSMDIYATDFHVRLTASDTIIEHGASVILQAAADEPYHVTQWRPADLFEDQGAAAQTIVPKISGQEYVIVAESDRFGCEDSARTTVRLNSEIFIPDAFTPNSDGRNDYFHPVGAGEPFTVNSFKVFDRWGKVLFTAEGAAALKGWDGTYNGQPAEIGTYFYTIEMQKYSGEIVDSKGDITLIR